MVSKLLGGGFSDGNRLLHMKGTLTHLRKSLVTCMVITYLTPSGPPVLMLHLLWNRIAFGKCLMQVSPKDAEPSLGCSLLCLTFQTFVFTYVY